MTMAELVETLNARGTAAGRQGVTAAQAAVATVAATELPQVHVEIVPDGVTLTAPDLAARATGTRTHGPDPRLVGLVPLVLAAGAPA